MDINELLSPQMKVKPLKEGETATFKLINAHSKEKGREEPSCPEAWALSPAETIFDKFANKQILLQSIKASEFKHDGQHQPYEVPILERIIFRKGVVTVTHEEHNFYVRLMRGNGRVDNPFRRRTAKKVYRIVKEDKETTDDLLKEDNRFYAERMVREGDATVLRAMIVKLNKSADARLHVRVGENEFDKMKLKLIAVTKWNPKAIMLAGDDPVAKTRIIVQDSETFNLLAFSDNTDAWYIDPLDSKSIREIFRVPPGKDRYEALIDFFREKDGSVVLVNLGKQLSKIYKATV